MTERDVEATRRRAALRGEEAVARWRLKSGAWSARVWAVAAAAPALKAVLWPSTQSVPTIIFSLVVAAVFVWLSFAVARGNVRASVALLALFALDRAMAVANFGARGLTQGLLVSVVIGFGLVQGVWGVYALRRIKHKRT